MTTTDEATQRDAARAKADEVLGLDGGTFTIGGVCPCHCHARAAPADAPVAAPVPVVTPGERVEETMLRESWRTEKARADKYKAALEAIQEPCESCENSVTGICAAEELHGIADIALGLARRAPATPVTPAPAVVPATCTHCGRALVGGRCPTAAPPALGDEDEAPAVAPISGWAGAFPAKEFSEWWRDKGIGLSVRTGPLEMYANAFAAGQATHDASAGVLLAALERIGAARNGGSLGALCQCGSHIDDCPNEEDDPDDPCAGAIARQALAVARALAAAVPVPKDGT